MSEQKKIHTASVGTFRVTLGIFLCLFSIALIINVGILAHAFAYPFLFFFGWGSYLIYVGLYIFGMWLIFNRKKLHFRFPILLGIIFFFFAFLLICSLACYSSSGSYHLPSFQEVFDAVPGGYFQSKIINVFSMTNPFGGGIIGYGFVYIFNQASQGLTIFIIILCCLLSLICFFFKFAKILFAKLLHQPLKEEKENERQEESSIPVSPVSNDTIPEDKNVTIEQPHVENNDFISSLDNTGVIFYPPKFNQNEDNNFPDNTSSDSTNQSPITPEPISFETNQEVKTPSFANVEQMELDFNKKPEYNEELLTKEVEYETPKVIDNTPPSTEINNNQVVEENKPVVKKLPWIPPSSDLLNVYQNDEAAEANIAVAEERKAKINEILSNFHINATCKEYIVGPSVTRYLIEYSANVSVRNVQAIIPDLSVRLGGLPTRFETVVEGQTYSGLEIPNAKATMVSFKEIFDALPDVNKHPTAVVFGKNISGKVVYADLDEFPHLLVAGTTGSGKSIYIHSLITTLIMRLSPDEIKIALVDPKKVEMTKYKDMPHLLCPIISESSKAKVMLDKLAQEMERRYDLFGASEGCTSIKEYNSYAKEKNLPTIPYMLAIIDEYADLVDSCKEIAQPVVSIAQKARAAGIHLIIATQRPSTNVINGVIKGNLPTRVALMTASYVDSNTIIGEAGAEKLLGKGDMLASSPLISRVGSVRLQGCYVQGKEINRVVGYLKEHYPTNYDPNYLDLVDHSKDTAKMEIDSGNIDLQSEDSFESKYDAVKKWVMCMEFVSMSKIQRECGVGFNRAGLMIKRLISEGIISEYSEGNKGNKVLMKDKFSNASDTGVVSEEISTLESGNGDN